MASFKVIDKQGVPIQTDVVLHPGEVLAMELEARQIKKADFAAQLGIKPSQLSELLHGKRHVGAQMAIRLENVLGIDAEFWMRVQTAFDIAVERRNLAGIAG
jgi:HTH-type transcriptional regulator/antitoxin HigA